MTVGNQTPPGGATAPPVGPAPDPPAAAPPVVRTPPAAADDGYDWFAPPRVPAAAPALPDAPETEAIAVVTTTAAEPPAVSTAEQEPPARPDSPAQPAVPSTPDLWASADTSDRLPAVTPDEPSPTGTPDRPAAAVPDRPLMPGRAAQQAERPHPPAAPDRPVTPDRPVMQARSVAPAPSVAQTPSVAPVQPGAPAPAHPEPHGTGRVQAVAPSPTRGPATTQGTPLPPDPRGHPFPHGPATTQGRPLPQDPATGSRPAPPSGIGRLRRAPVVVLVVAVLLAGLGYAGYRQFTGGPPEGWRTVTAPGYELDVPVTWTPAAPGAPALTVFGVPFSTAAQAPGYPCRGAGYVRGTAASALIAVPAGVGLDQAATAFARGAGAALYPGAGPQVAVGPASERPLAATTGSRVQATVRTDGAGGCRATEADVQVLVVPRTTAPDGAIGAAVLVVAGDLRGGPAQPPPLNRADLVAVLDSAAVP